MRSESFGGVWQCSARRCAVVLREVFPWLAPAELARAGAACRAWRRAAAEPALWGRHLRAAGARPPLLLAHEPACWRQLYVSGCGGWVRTARAPLAAHAQHAALAPGAACLAVATDDASLALWEERYTDEWREQWRLELRDRGWTSVARVQWNEAGDRLLLAGPLALVDDWELIVLHIYDGEARVRARVRCSPGAAGCWADGAGAAFLSLELRLLAPRLACTTVRLNSASQETHSEYAGVTATVLRIFNEDGAHISHAFVANVPSVICANGQTFDEHPPDGRDSDDLEYLRIIEPRVPAADTARVLVLAGGRALGAWALRGAPLPPPLLASAGGELAERVRLYRERRDLEEEEPPEPDESTLRAACTPPAYTASLPTLVVGLTPHPRGTSAWVATNDGGVTCVSLPALRKLLTLTTSSPSAPALYYVQPAVSEAHVVSPCGEFSRRVCTWSATCGARAPALELGVPAVCTLLPPVPDNLTPPTLLVLAGDQLHVWRSRATPQATLDAC